MACVRSTKLSDDELLAYLAGDADAGIHAHLADCHECQQRAAAFAALEQRLTTTLYRLDCPSSLTLGEYHFGLLSVAEQRAIAAHLHRCPHCTNEIAMLTNYLEDVAPTIEMAQTPTLTERVRVLVGRLIDALPNVGGVGDLSAAFAGLRGGAGDQRVYMADGAQIILDVQTDGQHPAQRVLLGLLLGLPDPQTITAHLWRADQPSAEAVTDLVEPVATTTVNELGNFIMPALVPGAYDLILSSDTTEVHIQALAI